MKIGTKTILNLAKVATVVVAFLLSPPAVAQDIDIAMEAYHRGDYFTALHNFKPLAEQGDAVAQYGLGVMYSLSLEVRQDSAEAAKWLRLSARQGLAPAQTDLAFLYLRGEGIARDTAEGTRLVFAAVEQGYAPAQTMLGRMYEDGWGVGHDLDEALKWYRTAAAQGDAEAQYRIGVTYRYGRGALIDSVQAAEWFRQAADQGYVLAQFELGMIYWMGAKVALSPGIPKDPVLAYMWFDLAAKGGLPEAAKYRDTVDNGMASEEIEEAENLVREWKPK